jgi:serine/threonine protein phosphatase PrpC
MAIPFKVDMFRLRRQVALVSELAASPLFRRVSALLGPRMVEDFLNSQLGNSLSLPPGIHRGLDEALAALKTIARLPYEITVAVTPEAHQNRHAAAWIEGGNLRFLVGTVFGTSNALTSLQAQLDELRTNELATLVRFQTSHKLECNRLLARVSKLEAALAQSQAESSRQAQSAKMQSDGLAKDLAAARQANNDLEQRARARVSQLESSNLYQAHQLQILDEHTRRLQTNLATLRNQLVQSVVAGNESADQLYSRLNLTTLLTAFIAALFLYRQHQPSPSTRTAPAAADRPLEPPAWPTFDGCIAPGQCEAIDIEVLIAPPPAPSSPPPAVGAIPRGKGPAVRKAKSLLEPGPCLDRLLHAAQRLNAITRKPVAPQPIPWNIGWASIAGPVRAKNEDYVLAFEIAGHQVTLLADGVSGEPMAGTASAIACRSAAWFLIRHLGGSSPTKTEDLPSLAENALHAAQRALSRKAASSAVECGLRTTLAIVVASPVEFGFSYIGDAKGAVLRTSGVTEDFLRPQRPEGYPTNVLSACLGPAMLGRPASGRLARHPGDLLILASDGVFSEAVDFGGDYPRMILQSALILGGNLQRAAESELAKLAAATDSLGFPSTILNAPLATMLRLSLSADRSVRPSAGQWTKALTDNFTAIWIDPHCHGPSFVDPAKTSCPICGQPFPTLRLFFPSLRKSINCDNAGN